MRLVGATPRQISVISAVEATVAAVAGVAARVRPLLRVPAAALSRPLHRHAPGARRPLAPVDRRGARRGRRPDRRSRVRAPRTPPRPDLAARRELDERRPLRRGPIRVIPLLAGIGLSRLLRRRRQAGQQRRPAPGAAGRFRAHRGGAGPRRTVADDGRVSTHDQAGESSRHAHRRSPAPRQPAGGLPVHQWAGARSLHHERRDRGAQLDRRRRCPSSGAAAPEEPPSPTCSDASRPGRVPLPPRFRPSQPRCSASSATRLGCAR